MTVIPNPPSQGNTFLNEVTGVTYEYDGEKWIVIKTPGSEEAEQISEDLTALTSRVSDGETVQGQIQETITDALVTQSEIQEDVSTLEAKVEALEGTVTDGTWRFTSRDTPLQGEFDLLDGVGAKINGDWSKAQFIYLTNPDYLNVNHTFEFLGLEDYIRIGGAGGGAVYRVKSGKTGTNALVEYQVEHVSSNGVVLESFAHDFEFTPGFDPTAYATISYVDEQDEKAVKKAGTSIVTDNFRIKTESKSFISLNNGTEMRLYHVADPTGQDDAWAANKGYVDTKADDKLPLAGGDLTGVVNFSGDARIKGLDNSGNEKIKIYPGGLIETKDGIRVDRSSDTQNCFEAKKNGTINFYVAANGRAATNYVVSNSDSIGTLATKKYVDDQVAIPYGSPYKYRNTDSTAQNLQQGEFFVSSEGNVYFHPFDQLGRELVTTGHHNHSEDVAGMFKVYDGNGQLMFQLAFNQYATGNSDNNYCKLFKNHSLRSKSSWSSTYTYYISDGFLLPY